MTRTVPPAAVILACLCAGAALGLMLRRPVRAGAAALADRAMAPRDRDYGIVRAAGPETMRDPPEDWDRVDEQSDESFPASDSPATY